ncbi:MAG: hypothetical protein A2Y81_12445 [Nitrospirae bacterium RBG_13_43_8]|nr:MAG: hypothetical protein A2Y81_12445 [Nitrospirae bacterium RBG_13_43_8]
MLIVDKKWYKEGSNERVITLCDNYSDSCLWSPPEIKRLNWSAKNPVRSAVRLLGSQRIFREAKEKRYPR